MGEKEGADSYVYADMYFKASISPTLRRFVIGVGCILRYFRFTMASLPPYLIPGGRRSNESPKHCVESIPRADIFVFDVFEATPIASPTNFSIVTRFFIFQDGWNIGKNQLEILISLRYLDCNLRSQTFALALFLSLSPSIKRPKLRDPRNLASNVFKYAITHYDLFTDTLYEQALYECVTPCFMACMNINEHEAHIYPFSSLSLYIYIYFSLPR